MKGDKTADERGFLAASTDHLCTNIRTVSIDQNLCIPNELNVTIAT
jgi:hypothetical protein